MNFIILGVVCLVIWGLLMYRKHQGSPEKRLRDLQQDNYSPWMGWLSAWGGKKTSKQRGELLENLNVESSNLTNFYHQQSGATVAQLQQQEAPRNFALNQKLHESKLAAERAMVDGSRTLLKDAVKKGRTLELDQDLKSREGQAQIDVLKHQQMTEIDVEKRWREYEQDINAADRNELTPHQLVDKLTKFLFSLFEDYRRIETTEPDEWLKQRKLEQLDQNIKTLRGIINARQEGLLLSENGPEVQRSLPPSNSGGGDGEEMETGEVEVPAKKPRGRPRKDSAPE